MKQEPERDFTIRALASEMNLSEERFNVLYQELFGVTPYTEIIRNRLVRAKRLLTATTMSLKEIALLCGWQDVHYFSRLFHQKEGCTPGEFRKGKNLNSSIEGVAEAMITQCKYRRARQSRCNRQVVAE